MSAVPPAPRLLAQLVDEVPVGLLLIDADGTIQDTNETLCRWTGLSAPDLVGARKLQDLLTVGGRIFHQTHWLPILQMQGSISEVKFQLRREEGEPFTAMLSALRKVVDGKVYDIVSVTMAEERNKYERQLLLERKRSDELAAREVHAQEVLRLAEAQVRHAVRVGALHLWYADDQGLRHFEPSLAAVLALEGTEADTVSEDALVAAMVDEDREAEAAAYRAALDDSDTVHSWTFRIRDAHGTVKVLLASGQAVGDMPSPDRRFVGVLRDITEEVRQSSEARDRASFAEQMVGIVSHDLRNPLFAISMGVAALKRDPHPDPRHGKMLERIESSTQRAKRLINELLDFTLVRVGHGITAQRRALNIHELVGRCVEELRLAFPDGAIRHEALGDGNGDGDCEADPDRVAQLLGNLVANAVTYGDAGSEILITTSAEAEDVVVRVHNFGPSIPHEMLERIFEPMVRSGTTDSAVRSVGLGLFIVRAIAKAHGGSVRASSTDAAGTSFTFAFKRRA